MEKKHLILREALRNYWTFQARVSQMGEDVLTRGEISISFFDIQQIYTACTPIEKKPLVLFPEKDPFKLSQRKKEAIYWNVILDMRQKDVAEIMGITTVSVGQYVEAGFIQIAKKIFD